MFARGVEPDRSKAVRKQEMVAPAIHDKGYEIPQPAELEGIGGPENGSALNGKDLRMKISRATTAGPWEPQAAGGSNRTRPKAAAAGLSGTPVDAQCLAARRYPASRRSHSQANRKRSAHSSGA